MSYSIPIYIEIEYNILEYNIYWNRIAHYRKSELSNCAVQNEKKSRKN